MTKSAESSSNEWHGLPKKRYGETFGQYLRRISPEQEFAMTMSARAVGVMPRSIFDSYIPTLDDSEA
jgi:hypothetical protein